MRIACPNCAAGYDFPVELLAADSFPARCPACAAEFRIDRSGAVTVAEPTSTWAVWPARTEAAPAAAVISRVRPRPPEPAVEAPPAPAAPVAAPPAPPPRVETPPAPPPRVEAPRPAPAPQPVETPAPDQEPPFEPDPVRPELLVTEPSMDGYLFVRGAPVPRPPRRRRVTATTRTPVGGRRPQARVVSFPATFGKPRRGDAPLAAPPATPPEAVSATPPSAAPRRRVGVVVALSAAFAAGAVGAVVGGLAWFGDRAAPPPEIASGSASAGPATAPAPSSMPKTLDVEIEAIDPLPEQRAAVVQGQVFNGTDAVQGAIRLEVTLRVDGIPKRRREVWCCATLDRAAAAQAANDPRHPHFVRDRDPTSATPLDPGEVRGFSVVFPALGDDLLPKRDPKPAMTAIARVKQSTATAVDTHDGPADPPSGAAPSPPSTGGAPASSPPVAIRP